MSPLLLLTVVFAYFALILYVSYRTGKGSNNESFFIGNRNSNWMLVAFGMIGSSLSGVTFVSVPGAVGKTNFSYLQITIGYVIGYIVIAYVLLPLYYRLKLTSIYSYLKQRMGNVSEKTGATIFIISRLVGATARLYLVVNILQITILDQLGIPFIVTTLIAIIMILLYTFEGGVKTIVWTDTLQTTFMLGGLIICTIYILSHLNLSFGESLSAMDAQGYTTIFSFDIQSKGYFIKQIIAGAFITITMTGIDQEMMQKSLSVTRLKDSQKNMVSLGFIMLFVIGLFLYLGGLLYLYAGQEGVAATGDALFPAIALQHMPMVISIIFIVALISALFPSADGAMTALTSSVCIDIINIEDRTDWSEEKQKKIRKYVHLIMAGAFLLMVLLFKVIDNGSMIWLILELAAFTYGPLLGLFFFGILSKRKVKDKFVPYICIVAPVLSYLIHHFQTILFGDFQIGLELLVVNGAFTFLGLYIFSTPTSQKNIVAKDITMASK